MNTDQTYPETAGARSSAEIEEGIHHTRERMDSTLDELGNRLSPRSLVNSAMDWFEKKSVGLTAGGGMKKTYHALASHVKNNPVPSLLIGAGVTWLLLQTEDDKQHSSDSAGILPLPETKPANGVVDSEVSAVPHRPGESGIMEKVREKAHDAKDAVTDAVEKLKAKVESMTDEAGKAAGGLAQNFDERRQYSSGKITGRFETKYDLAMERTKEAVEEYPLAVGAAFIALGALFGVILPRSRREDRLIGEKSDKLTAAVMQKGEVLLEQGKAAAEELGQKIVSTARENDFSPDSAGDKLAELAGRTATVIQQAVEDAAGIIKEQDTPSS